jgi:hypothetical protein
MCWIWFCTSASKCDGLFFGHLLILYQHGLCFDSLVIKRRCYSCKDMLCRVKWEDEIVDSEELNLWKKTTMVCFKYLQNSPGKTEENCEKPQNNR